MSLHAHDLNGVENGKLITSLWFWLCVIKSWFSVCVLPVSLQRSGP